MKSPTNNRIGQIRNSFHFLAEDYHHIRPKSFDAFFSPLSFSKLAKVLKIPRTSLYSEKYGVSEDFLKKFIIPFVMASDLAADIFQDKEKAKSWMLSPNEYFSGDAPYEVCLGGDGKIVIDLLMRHLGKQEGASY